jgi:hypothetical protein
VGIPGGELSTESTEQDGLLYWCAVLRLFLLFVIYAPLSSNQAAALDSIHGLLRSLIGPISDANYKIGNACFHVLYAYRDEREVLKTGRQVPIHSLRSFPTLDTASMLQMKGLPRSHLRISMRSMPRSPSRGWNVLRLRYPVRHQLLNLVIMLI